MLEEFLGREKTAPLLAKGWVDVMIDVDRDTGGKAINERLKGERQGGLPWMVILDADAHGMRSPEHGDADRILGLLLRVLLVAHSPGIGRQARGLVRDVHRRE